MATFKKPPRFADRGKSAETATQKYLEVWQAGHPGREYNRLVDSKAAGRIIKAAAADFEFYYLNASGTSTFGLLEVKETQHEYRLARDKLPQLPRLRKRSKCGGMCLVAILHSSTGKWRVVSAPHLAVTGDKGSWDLTEFALHDTVGAALDAWAPGVFH